ncbi:MAG TPA: hypothetical protein VGG84_00050, partial [Gemmatimonadaceae bacterium]
MQPAAHIRPTPRAQIAVFLAAVVSHLPALANQFAIDDAIIIANPAIASLRTVPAALTSAWWYTTFHLYRPLTLLSFAVERAIAGTSALPPHAVNLVLHGIVAVLLARLLARFVAPSAAIVGALFFAVLPVHAESVASVVGRAELLSALSMVALMLLVTGDTPPARRERMLAALLGALALASKEGGVVAPALGLAAAWLRPAQRPYAARWALSTAVGTLALLAARLMVLGTFGGDLANPVFRITTTDERIRIALSMIPRSAAMLVLPVRPAIDYVPTLDQLTNLSPLMIVLGVGLVAAVTLAMVQHFRRPSAIGLGAWILGATFMPTANLLFPSGVVLTGRTLYAPSMGVALLIAVVAVRLRGVRFAPASTAAAAMLLLVASWVTWHESAVWRSTASVVAEMQRRHPDDYRSFAQLAWTARDAGHDAEAVRQFREAARRLPGDPEMLTDAATVALRLHDTVTARAWLEQAVAVS